MAPRRRVLDLAVEHRLRAWIRGALELPSTVPVSLTEWVAMDSRATPHTVTISMGRGETARHLTIAKAGERISERDVRSAARAQSLLHSIAM
jgi:hypothetical protein